MIAIRQFTRRTTEKMQNAALLLFLFGTFNTACFAQNHTSCGGLSNSFGPFDYRTQAGTHDFKTNPNNPLFLVESAHFRPEMEALVRGGQGQKSDVGPEFDYTLRAFPNHHRALLALMRLAEREKTNQPKGMRYTIDCWFERAIRFQANDVMVRMIFANYLGSKNRRDEALAQLDVATQLANDNPFSHYNIGMIYADLREFDLALKQAHRAEELGMKRTELKQRLVDAKSWREPSSEPADDDSVDAKDQAQRTQITESQNN